MKKIFMWSASLVFALANLAFVSQAKAELGPLVISAIQITGGVGKTSEDFIELYNPNNEAVNLNGYRLVKRSELGTTDSSIKSWSSDTLIPPNSFYLWANSTFVPITAVPDTTTSSTLADNNGVGLRLGALDTGVLVDSVSWGSSSNGFTSSGLANPGAGESIRRVSLFSSEGFEIASSAPRNASVVELPDIEPPVDEPPVEEPPVDDPPVDEPPQEEDPPVEDPPIEEEPQGDEPVIIEGLEISELYPAPSPSEKEFVELHNAGSHNIQLSNLKLMAGTRQVVLPEVVLEPGEYFALVSPQLKIPLANSGKIIELKTLEDELVDSVEYPKAVIGQSLSLIGSEFRWTVAVTPNEANELVEPAPKVKVTVKDKKVAANKLTAKNVSKEQTVTKKINSQTTKKVSTGAVKKVANNITAHVPVAKNNESISQQINSETDKPSQSKDSKNAIALGLATITASGFAMYKFGLSGTGF